MAQAIPTFIALIICLYDLNIFSTFVPSEVAPISPLLSSQIVKIALYFLLLDVNFYHKSFRKISKVPLGIYELILCTYFMESAMTCAWFPMEGRLMQILPNMLKFLTNTFPNNNSINFIVRFFGNKNFLLFTSYVLSILILCCILHATRCVDFRLIRYVGIRYFFHDVGKKIRSSTHGFILKFNPQSLRYLLCTTSPYKDMVRLSRVHCPHASPRHYRAK